MASLPSFGKFIVHGEETTAGIRWHKWIAKLENLLCALDINTDARKKALLLHYAGDDVFEIYDSMTDELKGIGAVTEDEAPNEYNTLKQTLGDYFTPKKNISFETFKFRQTSQKEGENIDAFHTRLRSMALLCDFHDLDKEILGQVIQGCNSSKVRRKALKDDLSLKQVLDEARSLELSESRATAIEQSVTASTSADHSTAYTMTRGRTRSRGFHHRRGNHGHSDYGTKQQDPKRFDTTNSNIRGNTYRRGNRSRGRPAYGNGEISQQRPSCMYCGYGAHPKNECPAKSKICSNCGKIGHFAQVCMSAHKVRHVDNLTSVSDDDEHVFSLVDRITINSLKITAIIRNKPTDFVIDTGASVNILGLSTYKTIPDRPKLQLPVPKIFAFGSKSPLPVLGYFHTDISYKKSTTQAKFYVLESEACSNLLSSDTAQKMQLIQFTLQTSHTNIPDEFPALFDGSMGHIKDVQIKLHIDSSVEPIVQKHRRIPFHVRKDVEKELDRLEKLDIIEKVDGPTPWTSPVVIVPKKSGGIRVCVDMREPNKAIRREKHPMPTLDDLIADLNGSTVFSKLDLTNAYHQLELEKESRYITTFTTHVGLRRYKRLLFGVNAAAEIFQNTIAELLSNIQGTRNLSDDIIVHGKTQAEHDASLRATLKKLDESGAKVTKEKCSFSTNELTFFGHVFGEKGHSADPNKIEIITNTQPPKNVSEVRSFLGMTQYVSRFIPNYANMTKHLRQLTKQTTEWKWKEDEQDAFDKLKQSLTQTPVMAYFDRTKHTTVLVDASPVGLGAILTQNGNVICYASRALTPTEQRYSQTDRELLAVVYGAEHFHLYLFGANFTIITDHKPLLGIMKSQKPTTVRMERWRLRLMPYEMNLVYTPGRDDLNPADYISRHPQTVPRRENAGEAYIAYVTRNAIPKSMTSEEVKTATKQDEVLQKLMLAIQTGHWEDPKISNFTRFRDELSVFDGLVLRGHRLVIPDILQKKVVAIAHQAHQGIVKTKQCIREKVWFSGIDKLVEDAVKSCIPCQASYPGHPQREPIQATPLPSEPWRSLAIDFAGPYPSGDYLLVVIDEYSRFPEVEIVPSTSAKSVLPRLEAIFSRQGIPKTVKTDNGPPFHGEEFSNFMSNFGIHHRKITPLWPEANGEVERFMATINKAIRASIAENVDWKSQLSTFLRLYRGTPHTSTKHSPFESLTGRKMKIGLPDPPITNPTPNQVHSRIVENDDISKRKMSIYADAKRHTRLSSLLPGDHVLVKQKKTNKLSTPYCPLPYVITHKKGSMVTAQRGEKQITRNSSHFKPIYGAPFSLSDEEDEIEDDNTVEKTMQSPEFDTKQPRTPEKCIANPTPTPTPSTPVQTRPASPTVSTPVQMRPIRNRKLPTRLKDFDLTQWTYGQSHIRTPTLSD